jgi:hypothetical protein
MQNTNTAVTPDNLPAITHAGRPVVTTALLAKLYGTEDAYITKNLSRNRDRFIDGKHYFKLEGAELKALKDYTSQRHVVEIPKNTRQIILWTERGAARHAKMLDTEQAWEVFERLEDSYFGKTPVLAIEHKPEPLSPAHQRHIQNRVAELAGMDRKKYSAVWRGIKDRFQVGTYKDIPDSQYPAVCAFMMCRPLDTSIPTARVVMDAEPTLQRLNIHYPIGVLASRRTGMLTVRDSDSAWLDVALGDLRHDQQSLCENILFELKRAGYEVDGALYEIRTFRNKVRGIDSFVEGLSRVMKDPQRYVVETGGAA